MRRWAGSVRIPERPAWSMRNEPREGFSVSLATRCSVCNTVFRVVQDQLKVSEGWVRCGRCNQVFNALEGLFDLERDPQSPADDTAPPVPVPIPIDPPPRCHRRHRRTATRSTRN